MVSSLLSALTLRHWGRSTGTRSKEGTQRATRPEAGIPTSCALSSYYVRYGLSSAEGGFGSAAETVVFVLIDGQLAGYIALADEIRPESADAIQTFRDNNIKVYMATGDNEVVGKAVSEELSLDGYYAEVLPPLWR